MPHAANTRATIVLMVVAAAIRQDRHGELADGHNRLSFGSHVEIEVPCRSSHGLHAVLNRRPFASRPRSAPRGGRIEPVSTWQARVLREG
ncbi:hypothetical protein X737_26500 [Mesorhizobium sp. L48C026A00]|nr:hypothetical protein X737_26500 [Mesorhizobium sp. L48C026A00]